jgi:hypothetical protein
MVVVRYAFQPQYGHLILRALVNISTSTPGPRAQVPVFPHLTNSKSYMRHFLTALSLESSKLCSIE